MVSTLRMIASIPTPDSTSSDTRTVNDICCVTGRSAKPSPHAAAANSDIRSDFYLTHDCVYPDARLNQFRHAHSKRHLLRDRQICETFAPRRRCEFRHLWREPGHQPFRSIQLTLYIECFFCRYFLH